MKKYFPVIMLTLSALASCFFSGCSAELNSEEESDYFEIIDAEPTTESQTEAFTESETETLTEAEEVSEPIVTDIEAEVTEAPTEYADSYVEYHFRSKNQLNQHFEKHGGEFEGDFSYATAAEYEKGASDVINNDSALYKTEAEDGDGVYYIEGTNEFVILSTDGYIRTYFRPSAGKSYFDRQ